VTSDASIAAFNGPSAGVRRSRGLPPSEMRASHSLSDAFPESGMDRRNGADVGYAVWFVEADRFNCPSSTVTNPEGFGSLGARVMDETIVLKMTP
jgi:hypothetical protein